MVVYTLEYGWSKNCWSKKWSKNWSKIREYSCKSSTNSSTSHIWSKICRNILESSTKILESSTNSSTIHQLGHLTWNWKISLPCSYLHEEFNGVDDEVFSRRFLQFYGRLHEATVVTPLLCLVKLRAVTPFTDAVYGRSVNGPPSRGGIHEPS